MENTFTKNDLQINSTMKSYLAETAKWANFLSIVGFVAIAFMVIFALIFIFAGSAMAMRGFNIGAFSPALLGITYIVLAVICIFPTYFLNKFANIGKRALASNDERQLTDAFGFLKSYYKFSGIFTIVILGIYLLLFVFGMFGALAMSH